MEGTLAVNPRFYFVLPLGETEYKYRLIALLYHS